MEEPSIEYDAGFIDGLEEGKRQLQERIKELEAENEQLKERIKELEAIPRCPCGGELEGLGYDRRKKEIVFECKKCHAQILLQNDVWEQARKG